MALPAYTSAKTVLWYLDAGSEVRTRPALADALTRSPRVVVPYCVVATNELKLFHLDDLSELANGAHGIPEPRPDLRGMPDRHVEPVILDLAMVPGLAFDPSGNRLGQGKGYYDRLLARVRPDCLLVGLAFDCQIVPAVPVSPHDVPMHLVLTETRTYDATSSRPASPPAASLPAS